jgi:glycosyltransferase involved in cell wall biosynthesis
VKPVRLLHLVQHPIQYFAPLYREVSSRPEIELTVDFFSDDGLRAYRDPGFQRDVRWDVPLVSGYRHRFLSGTGPARRLATAREVLAGRHDVVWIHGYSSAGAWAVVAACVASRVPVLLRDEATLLDRRPPLRRAVKAVVLPVLFRFVRGLCIGTENRRYFEHYGLRGERLLPARYSVDNEFFAGRAEALHGQRAAIRCSFGLPPGQPVVLFCGKLVPKKDPLLLLTAFAEVRRRVPCSLLFAGDGELRPAIEERARREEIPDVSVTGFLNQSDLPRAYAAADVAVLPSAERETWGLAVNEAMNFGLPVVVSDRVGCAADLVVDGVNGRVVPSGSAAALARALSGLVTDPARRRRWGRRSKEIVSSYGVRDTADDIVSAVLRVART